MGACYMNYEAVKDVFERALDLPVEKRETFVIETCASDDILQEVLALLACSLPEDANDFSYEPMVGKTVGPYIVTKRIGSGGMGRVYEAKHKTTGKCVALKVLRKQFFGNIAGKRFEQEVRVLGSLNVSGVAKIESAGTVEVEGTQLPWVSMELVGGSVSITQFAKDKTKQEKLKLLREVCSAVNEAHKHGVIHRDLKPNNILVGENGRSTIIDFGIAKVLNEELRATGLHTQASGFLGAPQYMAPEQFDQNSSETTATDVFSLGVVAFEVLCGVHPFEKESNSIPEVMLAITGGEPALIKSVDPKLGGDISAVISKALSKEPRKRYASAGEFASDLQHIIDGEPVSAKPEPLLSKFVRKHRFATALLAITIPLLVAATAISAYYAINANTQLVRNEKLLEFANEAMQTQHYIVSQQPDYWKMHLETARKKADKLSGDNRALRLEMYELLGSSDLVADFQAEIYSDAIEISKKEYGESSPRTLILKATVAVGKTDGASHELIETLHELLDSWISGTAEEYVNFLGLIAYGELASSKKEIRSLGHSHSLEAIEIAKHELSTDVVINLMNRRVWSLIFIDGDLESINKAISLHETELLPHLENDYLSSDWIVLKAKTLLGVGLLSRSNFVTGESKMEDLNSAIALNEFVVDSLIEQAGDGYNSVWKVMNNLAISYALKAVIVEQQGNTKEAIKLKNRAATIWQRILQQVHFKEPQNNHHNGWYLRTFQRHLPALAPTDKDWETWLLRVNELPTRTE